MSTKRTTRIFGILCGTCLVFGGMYGQTGISARADDGELPAPEVHGTWQPQQLGDRPVERTRIKSDDKTPARATTAQRPASTQRPVVKDAQPARDTIAGAVARKALPWVAGTLACVGLVMVVYGLWPRRRPVSHQVACSITRLQASEAARSSGQRSPRARLALSLVQTDMPPLKVPLADQPEEQETRRAA